MRPSVFAVSLAAALLMPGAAAVADPPWERGHEHEARGCKFEYKAGRHGFKEEYKCDGSPRYAGGPPALGASARLAPQEHPILRA